MNERVIKVKTPITKDTDIFWLQCSCNSEALQIRPDYEYPEFEISVWKQGMDDPRWMSFREKIRWIWKIIKDGKPFTDYMIIDRNDALRLSKYLIRQIKKMGEIEKETLDAKLKEAGAIKKTDG
jgi:hypothetical protein